MKRSQKLVAGVATATVAGLAFERMFAAPRYHGAKSEHFDGRRFFNPHSEERHERRGFLKWMLTRERGWWPEWIDAPFGPKPPERVGGGAMRVTFINHSTTLLQMDGVNILTDPIWSERSSPVEFVGPRRHRAPGIRFEDLPPIDVVLVSHNHYDHLDVTTLLRLVARDAPRIVVPLGNGALLAKHGMFGVTELDWWNGAALAPGVRVTCVPAQHFSSRAISDRDANLWGGFVVSGPAGNAYFAGDTGWGPHFEEIGSRFAPIRLALLPIGSYLPRWFMKPMHMDPADAVRAHHALDASTSVAIHFGTFQLGDDGAEEPVHELRRALAAADVLINGEPRFWILDQGEGRDLP
jgi:L-ascorbate metabolism protein UlaG (beta-lactamase superfamily)